MQYSSQRSAINITCLYSHCIYETFKWSKVCGFKPHSFCAKVYLIRINSNNQQWIVSTYVEVCVKWCNSKSSKLPTLVILYRRTYFLYPLEIWTWDSVHIILNLWQSYMYITMWLLTNANKMNSQTVHTCSVWWPQVYKCLTFSTWFSIQQITKILLQIHHLYVVLPFCHCTNIKIIPWKIPSHIKGNIYGRKPYEHILI